MADLKSISSEQLNSVEGRRQLTESAISSSNKTRYRVDYYNSVKNYACTYVNAYSEAEARLIVQKVFGDEIWEIDQVVEID